jgi:hypothetical protein
MKALFKLNSVQVMAFWSALGGIIVAMWPVAQWAITELLPHGPLRIAFAVMVSAVTFGSYVYARCRPQPKLKSNG